MRLTALAATLLLVAMVAAVAPFAWSRVTASFAESGTIVVESEPSGAEVLLDGREAGKTPLAVKAPVGLRHVEVGSGGASKATWIEVKEDATSRHRVELPDAGARGGLRITTNPPGGRVAVNGGPPVLAPLRVANLKPGTHRVTAEGPFGPMHVEAAVKAGEVLPLVVQTAGWLKVHAPFELQITERGRVFGSSKDGAVLVPAGRHHFDLINTKLAVKARYFFDVPPGATIPIYFEEPLGMLNLTSDEPAEVLVDGKPAGHTPLTGVATPLGEHEVVFRHPRLGDVRYTVLVTLAAPVRITVTYNNKK
jgi:hypothetical protein